ncbi:MAG: HAD family hydrolase [Promethearchaeota archaeon]
MIKNIIFDLGNVLINFKPRQFLLRYTKDDKRITNFVQIITGSETWLKLDQGLISLESGKNYFLSRYSSESELINIFFDHWKEMLTPISKNVEVLRKLKMNGYKTYILSNYINEAYKYVRKRLDFFKLFDGIVISSKIKLIKPELRIFQHILQKYNLTPEESVFIDDLESCVSQAGKVGINTIHYLPETDLTIELRKFDIKI